MTDHMDAAARSALMSRIKGKDTLPERVVRSALFRSGLRFRLHKKGLPGRPDLVLPRYRLAIFVHGCFWHGHDCRKGRSRPQSNVETWQTKLDRNRERDRENQKALIDQGWRVHIIWECDLESGIAAVLEAASNG